MEENIRTLSTRPKAPKTPIQCPFCSEQPPMQPGKLAQHVRFKHPLEWKGNIYEIFPPDFDYGNGPLDFVVLAMLIKYSGYFRDSYNSKKRG